MSNDVDEKECELTILMPCLNEAETIATCINKAQGYLERSGINGEIVVSDNGSTDGSQDIARELGAKVYDVSMLGGGYGSGLKGGIGHAKGKFVIMGDSDDSYDFSSLDAFVERLRSGDEMVMGNRFKGGIEPGAMPSLHRYFGNPVLTWIGRLFFKSPIGDFNCGLRGFRKDVIESLDLQTIGMEFASEMVVKATINGVRIGEVPTTLSPDGRSRRPHLKSWSDGWRVLRFLLMYSPRWLFLFPGLALLILGFTIMGLVLPAPLSIGSVVFDVHTLVVAMGMIVVGSQLTFFYVFATQFAINERLLPARERFARVKRFLSLERSAIAGTILFTGGVLGILAAVFLWGGAEFGDLDYGWMMRLIIPSVTSMAFGIQITLAGFFSSILDIKIRRR